MYKCNLHQAEHYFSLESASLLNIKTTKFAGVQNRIRGLLRDLNPNFSNFVSVSDAL